jgi:hypothetical protein
MPRARHEDTVIVTPAASVAAAALRRVECERFEARAAGVTAGPYVARLDKAIANARRRYVVSAVTELASLRGEMNGSLLG